MNRYAAEFLSVVRRQVLLQTDEKTNVTALDKLEKIAQSHRMSVIFCGYLKQNAAEAFTPERKRKYDLLTYRYVKQKEAYARLADRFEQEGIDYLPLKGIELARLYPAEPMREMADLDILVRPCDLERVRKILCADGFTYAHKGHHDVYTKAPGICFEIHESAVDRKRDTGMDAYFADPFVRAVKDGHRYEMDPSDTYIYLMTHLYGHFHQGGIGVRAVLDLYLYEKNCAPDLETCRRVFAENGMEKFAENVRRLCRVWFEGENEDALMRELGTYIITSGSYGQIKRLTLDLSEESGSKKKNLWKIIKRKAFLNREEIQKRYSFAKNPLLLPFAYPIRFAALLFRQGKEVRAWLSGMHQVNAEEVKEQKERMKRFGAEDR